MQVLCSAVVLDKSRSLLRWRPFIDLCHSSQK